MKSCTPGNLILALTLTLSLQKLPVSAVEDCLLLLPLRVLDQVIVPQAKHAAIIHFLQGIQRALKISS